MSWGAGIGLDMDEIEFDHFYLTVSVGESVLELLPLGELPAQKVMEFLSAKESKKIPMSIDILKLAAKNPSEAERELEFISFNELLVVLDVWMEESSKYFDRRKISLAEDSREKSKARPKKRAGVSESLAKTVTEGLVDSEDLSVDLADKISMALSELSEIFEDDSVTSEVIVKLIALWFVRYGYEQDLIEGGLLSERTRTGRYYPIIDGKVARRLGFTLADAVDRFPEGGSGKRIQRDANEIRDLTNKVRKNRKAQEEGDTQNDEEGPKE